MVYETELKGIRLFKKGKVRDVYELDDKLLIVATDRVSCFDVVLPTPIPDKGKLLTQISLFWFSFLKDTVSNHLISGEVDDLPNILAPYKDTLEGRFMLTKKCEVIPFECVVRGYLAGSGWKEYKTQQSVCGIELPVGLREADKLPEAIYTPATKATSGHDENVNFDYVVNALGRETAERLRNLSISIYKKAASYAESRGIIIADTKFEFGIYEGKIILIDEVLTPDSSRFWPKDSYEPGRPQASFDKQFVRDYLESIGFNKTPPAPELPSEVVSKTQEKYASALKMLVG